MPGKNPLVRPTLYVSKKISGCLVAMNFTSSFKIRSGPVAFTNGSFLIALANSSAINGCGVSSIIKGPSVVNSRIGLAYQSTTDRRGKRLLANAIAARLSLTGDIWPRFFVTTL